jgi:DNA-binding NtrC family response regulator
MTRQEFQERHGIIGQSVEMQEIVDIIRHVAPTDITVLITGESGVGKEVIAKAIHAESKRAGKQMITVNCGAIPEGIIESELFGHEKGAFTGASETRKGYFELADGGTILLDEIGELPLGTQVKFLRVLENGEFMRVGSATPRTVDVRVIAATNKDLESLVRTGSFRVDLFYRLRSINVHVPSLRSRKEDIPLFVEHFADEFAVRNNIRSAVFSPDAIAVLKNYLWEGNVRELRNLVESMLVIEQGKVLRAEDVRRYLKPEVGFVGARNLPVHLNKTAEQAERELIYRALLDMKSDILQIKNLLAGGTLPLREVRNESGAIDVSQGEVEFETFTPSCARESGSEDVAASTIPLDEMERLMITRTLKRFNGNRRMAAAALRISERTLYRKIKEYGLNEK